MSAPSRVVVVCTMAVWRVGEEQFFSVLQAPEWATLSLLALEPLLKNKVAGYLLKN